MKQYLPKTFTWGYEIEFGDIDRRLKIPEHLGRWEYSETDILNLRPPYKYIACDPLGIDPPMGGEINTVPTRTWKAQVRRILEIIEFFQSKRNRPTTSCVSHGHVHVYVPGLREDLRALKRLTAYIRDNQHDAIAACYQFKKSEEMKKCDGATMYLKFDGGRPMPEFMCENIIKKAKNFSDFIRLQAAGKDGVSMGRPFRYAINTYCMKHTGTVEFRCFRATTKKAELESQFRFVEAFMNAALNGGPGVREILAKGKYTFPPFVWRMMEYQGWKATKYPKERGKKQRIFLPV